MKQHHVDQLLAKHPLPWFCDERERWHESLNGENIRETYSAIKDCKNQDVLEETLVNDDELEVLSHMVDVFNAHAGRVTKERFNISMDKFGKVDLEEAIVELEEKITSKQREIDQLDTEVDRAVNQLSLMREGLRAFLLLEERNQVDATVKACP
jgi:hypothetical protein